MLLDYIRRAMRRAKYELLPEDGVFYGEIPECRGVYATGPTLEGCRDTLAEVLEDWILIRVHRHLPIPAIDGVEIRVTEVA